MSRTDGMGRRWLTSTVVVSMWLLLGGAGCSGCDDAPVTEGPTPDTGRADVVDVVDDDVIEDTGPDTICTPGEVLGCRQENTQSIEVCSEDGMEIVGGSCPDGEICRQGACVEVLCIPGKRSCATPRQPQVCNDEGDGFESLEACEGESRCDEGICLDQCKIAELTNSYIGCEYWAVELENGLLNDDGGEQQLPPDRHPPYAIVLANTSPTSDAHVTVYTAGEQIAEAVPSRTVGTDFAMPGLDLVTVHSEVIDESGARVAGPLEGPIEELRLPPKSLMTLILPHRPLPYDQTTLTDQAYRIKSTYPVVAYQFNPLCCNYNYTNDASLLLPTTVLTKNYMHMSFAVWAGTSTARLPKPRPATLTVVATKPDTVVDVQLSQPTGERTWESMIYPIAQPNRVSGPDASGKLQVTMQPFEVLNIAGAGTAPVEDLTGTRVTSSEPVAVFGGHSCTNVPFTMGACDHLESQLFPMETWGNRFVAAPLKLRGEPDDAQSREGTYWKFVARENNTRIETGISIKRPNVLGPAGESVKHCSEFAVDPESGVFTLDAGQTCEFGSKQMFVAMANRPIMVGAFVSGQVSVSNDVDWGDHAGDPAFFLLPPQEQYRSSYSFLTPATYHSNYVTVTIMPGFKIILDDQELNVTDFDHEELPRGGVIRAHIPVDDGPHTISADIPFGLVAYGYDNFVSYAYTGGLDLKKLSDID